MEQQGNLIIVRILTTMRFPCCSILIRAVGPWTLINKESGTYPSLDRHKPLTYGIPSREKSEENVANYFNRSKLQRPLSFRSETNAIVLNDHQRTICIPTREDSIATAVFDIGRHLDRKTILNAISKTKQN